MCARIRRMEPETWSFRTSLEECLKVFCPDCGARPGTQCMKTRDNPRTKQHGGRHEEAGARGAKPVISREEWAESKRWNLATRRSSQARYSNLRRDGW